MHSKTCIFIENDFDIPLFYSISYLFINKSVHVLYIYSHYLMKLHEFFFFLQAHAEFFFLVQFLAWIFFGSDNPPPRISNGPSLSTPISMATQLFKKHSFLYLCNNVFFLIHGLTTHFHETLIKSLLYFLLCCNILNLFILLFNRSVGKYTPSGWNVFDITAPNY